MNVKDRVGRIFTEKWKVYYKDLMNGDGRNVANINMISFGGIQRSRPKVSGDISVTEMKKVAVKDLKNGKAVRLVEVAAEAVKYSGGYALGWLNRISQLA